MKARPAMASLLVVRTSTDPPKRQVNRIRFGDHQATEVEFLALRSIDGPLIEPRNDFRRDILDDSPPMVIVIRASAVLAPTMSMRLPPTLPCHRPLGWIRPTIIMRTHEPFGSRPSGVPR